jgi:two-component system LytT family response regulator
MTAIVIDDEPAAINSFRKIASKACPSVTILGEAANIREGLLKIEKLKPDLIFLDIQMPGGSGFDLIRQLPKGDRPEIVFVTSEDRYAMQAIQVAALSYLIKPLVVRELRAAVVLAEKRIRQKNSEVRLEALLSNLGTQENALKKIGIPSDTGLEFIDAGDIIYCEGEEGYTRIHVLKEQYRLSSYSIGEYRKMLAAYDFFAVHRSYLVNRRYVKKYDRSGVISLTNGMTITVSRRRKAAVTEWLAGANKK